MASIDLSGIKHYLVYMNGALKTTVPDAFTTVTGLSASTTYSFYVVAVDNVPAANTSAPSAAVQATTPAPPDTTAPVITVAGVTSGGTYTTSRTITFSATDAVDGPVAATAALNAVAFTITAPPVVLVPVEGPNRYATAIAASKKAFPQGSEYVVVATGMNWPDALGGSALAGALDAPILLTATSSLPAEVRAEIVRLGATKAIVLGGTPAVSAAVFSQIDAIAGVSVERISGPNRYDTANAVAARTIAVMRHAALVWDKVALATGENFPDALSGGVLQGADGSVLLLTPTNSLNAGVGAKLAANKASIFEVSFLGSTPAVSQAVRTAVWNILKR